MAPIVGPPEIHHSCVSSHSTGDPFTDLMSAPFNNPYEATTRPPMALTKNQSPTFLSTGDLNFFFHVLPDTPPKLSIYSSNRRGIATPSPPSSSTTAKSLSQKSIIQKMLSVPPPIGNAPEVARELRKKEAEQAKRAMERYNRDLNYQLLHDQISECFAQLLPSDLALLRSGEMGRIGLAAKWCPSSTSLTTATPCFVSPSRAGFSLGTTTLTTLDWRKPTTTTGSETG